MTLDIFPSFAVVRVIMFASGFLLALLITTANYIHLLPVQAHHIQSNPSYHQIVSPKKQFEKYRTQTPVIVTAANSAYFGGLENKVGSIHHWAAHIDKIVIWDLGLLESEVDAVKTWCKCEYKNFTSLALANNISWAPKNYIWKPLIIKTSVDEIGIIIYSDGGSDFRGPIIGLEWYLQAEGHLFVHGQDSDMTQKSHESTYKYLGFQKEQFMGRYSYGGNSNGWIKHSPAYEQILIPWIDCALVPDCMAPVGTSTGNHRFDQTVLSILIYSSNLTIQAHTEMLESNRNDLPTNPTTPSFKCWFTGRAGSKDYVRFIQFNGTCDTLKTDSQHGPEMRIKKRTEEMFNSSRRVMSSTD